MNTAGPKYRGISWSSYQKRWAVRLRVNGRDIHLGAFKDADDAAMVHDHAARVIRKENAIVNFPDRIVPLPLRIAAEAHLRKSGIVLDS